MEGFIRRKQILRIRVTNFPNDTSRFLCNENKEGNITIANADDQTIVVEFNKHELAIPDVINLMSQCRSIGYSQCQKNIRTALDVYNGGNK